MLKCSLRLFQAATPISKAEFVDAISRVFPEVLQDGKHKMGRSSIETYIEGLTDIV
jgi:hypothetical protein